jgi:trehalose 6-phosphate phosphatase
MLLDEINLQSNAILLDIDGTVLDIAPTPFDVKVPQELLLALTELYGRTGGALAFVSGRPIEDIDRLFDPLRIATVGGHGAEMRVPGLTRVVRHGADLDDRTRALLATAAAQAEGVIFEDKGYSVALHYRLAPEQAEAVRAVMGMAYAEYPSAAVELLPGKGVIELKSAQTSKGSGIRELMLHSPFLGRKPIFIGDDVSDETGFAVMPEFGGLGFSVGRKIGGLAGWFQTPADVRQWICKLVSKNLQTRIA